MKDHLHHQINMDIKQSARMDLIVVIIAIILNLLFLGINSGVASGVMGYDYSILGLERSEINATALTTLILLLIVVVVINFLAKVSREEGVEQYYDASLEQSYNDRTNLLGGIIVALGALAVLVPIIVAAMGG